MPQKTIKTTAILGAAFVGSLATFSIANANDNPFSATQLDAGYMQLAEAEGSGDKGMEGKCGGDKEKEGKCGGEKGKEKGMEGKCGEGKCGGKT